MKTNLYQLSDRDNLQKLFIIALILATLLYIGCLAYRSEIKSSQFKDTVLRDAFQNIEQIQKESDWFRDQGQNKLGLYISLSLVLGVIFGSALAVIEATKLWKKTAKQRLVLLFVIALLTTFNSAAGLFLKVENERFYNENKQFYLELSVKLNTVIRDFYMEFQGAGYSDNNIAERREQFLSLAKSTFDKIDDLRLDYNKKYKLNTNPSLP